jgi:hypothetical protein
MAEHDARFKTLLREFFAEFLELSFPDQAAGLDLSHPEWLDKELHPDPPAGDVLLLDLVARVGLRSGAEAVALVHIEVESRDAVMAFRRRMLNYYHELRRRYDVPVVPVAVYLRVGRDGLGVEEYAEEVNGLSTLTFHYLYVGLPALDAEQYVRGANGLGIALAALMRIPPDRRAWLRAEALRRVLKESGENDYRRLLLSECVEAYLALEGEQQTAFEQLLEEEQYREVMAMQMTTYEKGVAAGEAKGEARGRAEARAEGRLLVRAVLEARFGSIDAETMRLIETWPVDQLEELARRAAVVASSADLRTATDAHAPPQ